MEIDTPDVQVVKIFDTEDDRFRPNCDVMEICGHEVDLMNLSSDRRFVQIS